LRTPADRAALRQALQDGTIDCIASHHLPQHWDDKTCEFEYAKNGSINLETVFGVANNFISDTENLVSLLADAPRKIFGLPVPELTEGAPACLTLFTTGDEVVFEEKMIRSKSKNCAFTGKRMKGRVIGIINNNKLSINEA
jgi:dihydroorotase